MRIPRYKHSMATYVAVLCCQSHNYVVSNVCHVLDLQLHIFKYHWKMVTVILAVRNSCDVDI